MDAFFEINRALHIVTGVSTLIAGPVAIFYNFKKPKNHRIAGQIFFWSMMHVTASAVTAWFRIPQSPFFQFLALLALMVFVNMIKGLRAIRHFKGASKNAIDEAVVWAHFAIGGAMLALGAFDFSGGEKLLPIAVLLSIFGASFFFDGLGFRKRMARFEALDRRFWLKEHITAMMGGFTASTTAFTVQTCHFLPIWAQWFGPTLLLLPFTFYFLNVLKLRKTDLASLC